MRMNVNEIIDKVATHDLAPDEAKQLVDERFRAWQAAWWRDDARIPHLAALFVILGLAAAAAVGLVCLFLAVASDHRVDYCYLRALGSDGKPLPGVYVVQHRPWAEDQSAGPFGDAKQAIAAMHELGCSLKGR